MTTLSPALLSSAPCCGTLVTADGRTLPLRQTRLVVRAAGGFAQVRLVQTFANPHHEPLHVRYQLPLPADAAVGGFEFRLGALRVVGDIDRRSSARERFEQAIASGRTAALLEQDRSSLFTQELGNVPPGAEVEATIDVDQPLAWVDGSWQWRFPTTVAPRYLGAAGRVGDARQLAVDVVDPNGAALPPRCELELVIADALTGSGQPQSPSHALQIAAQASGTSVVFAAAGGRVAMDRDVVMSWPVAAPQVGMTLRVWAGVQVCA
jgi:Ca-activated chloride channel family protein